LPPLGALNDHEALKLPVLDTTTYAARPWMAVPPLKAESSVHGPDARVDVTTAG
jgi:hypothetical protein